MKLDDIRNIANGRGIKPGKLNKTQLVRTLQREEGNSDCFATPAISSCGQMGCLWREDCATTAQKGGAA